MRAAVAALSPGRSSHIPTPISFEADVVAVVSTAVVSLIAPALVFGRIIPREVGPEKSRAEAARVPPFHGGRTGLERPLTFVGVRAIAGGRDRRTREAGRTVTSSLARRRCPNFACWLAAPAVEARRSCEIGALGTRRVCGDFARVAAASRFGRASPRNAKDITLTLSDMASSYVPAAEPGRRRGVSFDGVSSPVLSGTVFMGVLEGL